VAPAERIAYQARQLLQRYGIVTRECLENEEGRGTGRRYISTTSC
jgi:hypothetical protein